MKKIAATPLATALLAMAIGVLATSCTTQPADSRPASSPPQRLFLQQVTDTSAIVKWRGDARQLCLVEGDGNARCQLGELTEGFHREVMLTGLEPDTEYAYRLDSHENRHYRFRTAPPKGQFPASGSIHLWLLGDSGSASIADENGEFSKAGDAIAVMDGYKQFTDLFPGKKADLILMLGDNAYYEGTDEQWQRAVFDLYHPMIFQAPIWPTIGNHEMGAASGNLNGREVTYPGISRSADPDSFWSTDNTAPRRMPYLDIFSLPSRGEAGGIASGTEQYYSFDYGTLHVVSLDSQLSARDPAQRAAMLEWLKSDLQANTAHWTLVIFHHPPYSKSSHDSDTAAVARLHGIDDPMLHMRTEFTEIFEEYGVDMVYSGHSHAYERSYYLRGHRGDSHTFDPELHAELGPDGEPVSGRPGTPYFQISPTTGADDRVVYTVAGSAGLLDIGHSQLDHPAHVVQPADPQGRRGLEKLGSVHVEVSESTLVARFLDTGGQVLDQVEIRR